MRIRELFFRHVAQTSDAPLALEIQKAKGCFLFDEKNRAYLDGIGGISVCNVGHGNDRILQAIKEQAEKFLHVMVYGETIQSPQVQYATKLAEILPDELDSVYFTNSGSEATEGSMKLAKRFTGRKKIISFKNSYHGSTQGALSVMGSEYWQEAFGPLLPEIYQFEYNAPEVLDFIDDTCAGIILEPMQSEAGVHLADENWIKKIREKCKRTGTLMILDEIQTGFGRCGQMFAFKKYDIVPDILLLGKALGGGMPMGAFISQKEIMNALTHDPVLGHITTFGGHALCCAAGLESLNLLQEFFADNPDFVFEKERLFLKHLRHERIIQVSSFGLLIAIHFENAEICKKIIDRCIENGLFTDWFLFAPQALRLAPPLVISEEEILQCCAIIKKSIEDIYKSK